MTATSLGNIELERYPRIRSGKVREIFDLGDRLLFVATDRVSAFDVILPDLIRGKGALLTAISAFWFEQTRNIMPNHLIGCDISELDMSEDERKQLDGRSMIVRRAERIDVECVVRARLAGSGWEEYRRAGTLAGQPLPAGLRAGDALPELRFTLASKNDSGHDENISTATLAQQVGAEMAGQLEDASLRLFRHAWNIAEQAGFVLADSKFEFGLIDGTLTLIDEALTPDSSRYWNMADLAPGKPPEGYDKQVIRNWLIESGWDKEPPGPALPAEIIELALGRYEAVLTRLRDGVATQDSAGE
jgi:phosphoribosylaminoimidazole-succinocarboxamide synthase